MPLPESPTHLRELLDQALNEDEKPFFRASAMATLLTRLEAWFEEFVAYAEERGGTLGFSAQGLREWAREKDGSTGELEIEVVDGRPVIRGAREPGTDTPG